jgi:hypothetical protein
MKKMQDGPAHVVAARIRSLALLGIVVLVASVTPVGAWPGRASAQHNPKRVEKAQKKAARLETQRAPVNDRVERERVTVTDIRRIARANGYNQGFDNGMVDKRHGTRSAYREAREYQKGVTGYQNDFNALWDYRNAFRDGYAAGYRDGYAARNRNMAYDYRVLYRYYPWYRNQYYDSNDYYRHDDPRMWVAVSYSDGGYGDYTYVDDHRGNMDPEDVARRAAQNGYAAGYERGRYDAIRDRGRPNPNPQGHGAYQFALDGWSREWGSGATYQNYYRHYFVQGYNDAYEQRRRAFVYKRM